MAVIAKRVRANQEYFEILSWVLSASGAQHSAFGEARPTCAFISVTY